jgi:phospholipid/cholesterol/gamma-HCH transport system substrate-binding protein
MTDTERNLWVGIFVVVSMLVLGTLMIWFGEAPSWMGGNEWTLRITDVQELRGVDSGSPIQLNGVEIGRVKELEFVDTTRPDLGVEIVARIKDPYVIPEGAVARVYGATLGIGTGHVEIITPPDRKRDPLPKEGASIRGEMHSLIGELITKDLVASVQRTIDNIGNFADASTPVATNLAELLEPRTVADVRNPSLEMTANLATVVERIDTLAANLNVVLGDVNVQRDVKDVVGDLKTITADLKETVQHWKTASVEITSTLANGLDKTEKNLDQSFTKLNHVLDNLDDGTRSLSTTMQRIAEGQGTAGLLVRDERLYESAVVTFERLSEAIASLQCVLGKIERDGYVTVGLGPGAIIKKKYPIPLNPQVTDIREP